MVLVATSSNKLGRVRSQFLEDVFVDVSEEISSFGLVGLDGVEMRGRDALVVEALPRVRPEVEGVRDVMSAAWVRTQMTDDGNEAIRGRQETPSFVLMKRLGIELG